MPKILKILTGPQEGAELELDNGFTLRLGTEDACDVVLVDSMAPPQALDLTLADDGSTLTVTAHAPRLFVGDTPLEPDATVPLELYAVITIGSTRCAVGDSDRPWPPLRWIPLDTLLAPPPQAAEPEPPQPAPKTAEPKPAPAQPAAPATPAPQPDPKRQQRRQTILAILCWLIVAVICLAAIAFTAKRAWAIAKPPQTSEDKIQKLRQENIQSLIAKYHLNLETLENIPCKLTGNLATRADRLLVEQVVTFDYPDLVCELTDDETLANAVRELLQGMAKDCLVLKNVTGRVATIIGMTDSEAHWKQIQQNLHHDIPRLLRIDADIVYADVQAAKLQKALDVTGFNDVRVECAPGELRLLGTVPEDRRTTFTAMLNEALRYFPENVRLANLVKWILLPQPPETAADNGDAPTLAPCASPLLVPDLPIQGIMVHPFPYVILKDGSRLSTGAIVAGFTVKTIELTSLTLEKDGQTLTWIP